MKSRVSSLLILAFAVLASSVFGTPLRADEDRAQPRPSLERIPIDPALVDVGDGDTVTIRWSDEDRERVRILGIDTPEIAHPRFGMPIDQTFGPEATAFAAGVFAVADRIELLRAAETDPYGRTLGYLFVNGRNYSVLAVAAGFAVETVSHYGDNGLPAEAAAVLEAAQAAGPVLFEEPYRFRRRMREVEAWSDTQEPQQDRQ